MKHNENQEFCVYGFNGVLSVLSSNACKLTKIFISEKYKSNSPEISHELEKNSDKVTLLTINDFKSRFHPLRTQGIVAYFNFHVKRDLPITISEEDNICYVILDSIKDPQNLGQILRTCECAGVSGVILPDRRSVPITDTVLQVSQGAFCNLDIIQANNIKYTINDLKKENFWVIGVENSIESKSWFDINMAGRVAFVFGSEGEGIRDLITKYCDYMATIPMLGKINSLNISATVSAILFERNRQILDK